MTSTTAPAGRRRPRTRLFPIHARAIRGELVERARARLASRHGEGSRVTVEVDLTSDRREVDLLQLDDALEKLNRLHWRQALVVELSVFGGLSAAEIGVRTGTSKRTVEKDLAMARAWLDEELSDG